MNGECYGDLIHTQVCYHWVISAVQNIDKQSELALNRPLKKQLSPNNSLKNLFGDDVLRPNMRAATISSSRATERLHTVFMSYGILLKVTWLTSIQGFEV